jgi:small-conductance mechanosensitive channel
MDQAWLTLAITWGTILTIGCVGHLLIYRLLLALARRTHSELLIPLVRRAYRPAQWLGITIFISLSLPALWPFAHEKVAQKTVSLVMIILVSMTVMRSLDALRDYLLMRFKMEDADNRRARMIHTQLNLFRRVAFVLVCAVALGTALMTFESVRNLGSTLLASAGIVGVIVGIAAQRTLGTFIAGLQIAVTQPIRLDDVVIVEGEWGRIEEITLTYVVVRIWDQRRLIVPINHFIEKPFQNWTRISADLLGTVYLYVDYTVPTEPIREQLKTLLEASPHWDQRVCVLQVTHATERTVELRALMSARNSSAAWDLRCEIREKLLVFIQERFPEHLPKVRAELESGFSQGEAKVDTNVPTAH